MSTWTHGNPFPEREPFRRRYEEEMSHIICDLLCATQGVNTEVNMLHSMWNLQRVRKYFLAHVHVLANFSHTRFLLCFEEMNNVLLGSGYRKLSNKECSKFVHFANEASKELYDPAAKSSGKYFDQDEFDKKHKLGKYRLSSET